MKIKALHSRAGKLYWLAELRVKGRLMLCEGQNYKDALHGAITLLIEQGEAKARQRFLPHIEHHTSPKGLFLYPEKLHECHY